LRSYAVEVLIVLIIYFLTVGACFLLFKLYSDSCCLLKGVSIYNKNILYMEKIGIVNVRKFAQEGFAPRRVEKWPFKTNFSE